MDKVKIKLPRWENDYYLAEKITRINHRGVEKHHYKVISRHSKSDYRKEIVSTGMAGMIYYPSEVLEIN